MTYVETTSYGSRLIESIKGVLLGLVLFGASFPLLWWNEGRAVQTADSLKEGAAGVVSVTGFDPANEGKLVHFSGQAKTDEVLADPEFGVSAAALRLRRDVEMYQWYEKSETRENTGGSSTTTYTYGKKWSDSPIDSSDFKEAGHTNPSDMRVMSADMPAKSAKLGDFDLSLEIIREHVDAWDDASAAAGSMTVKLPADLRSTVKPNGEGFYLGNDPGNPNVGDLKIAYRVVKSPQTMSIVARQVGRGFAAFATKAGDEILLTAMTAMEARAMFKSAEESNTTLTWILRGVGWFVMMFGIFLVLRPISMVANFIPFAGSMVSFGALLLASIVSTGLSLVTVALAWIAARPLLGSLILAAALSALAVAGVTMVKARVSKTRGAMAGDAPVGVGT
jgi:hypothetical protein